MFNSDTPMQTAIKEAIHASQEGEIPVGAVLVYDGKIVARSGNVTITDHDPTAHAEINVIRKRCKELGVQRLPDHDLYVTLEPCPMCAAAISNARIRRVYFGAYDPKSGGVDHGAKIFTHSQCHHKPDVFGGVEEKTCVELLKDFFDKRR
jgi:tRNA(adenine34) deaminase